MYYLDIAMILLIIAHFGFTWMSISVLFRKITELGDDLATAIMNATDSIPDIGFEDVDPIKMAIAGWIQSATEKAANTTTATIIPAKDDSGKFMKNIEKM